MGTSATGAASALSASSALPGGGVSDVGGAPRLARAHSRVAHTNSGLGSFSNLNLSSAGSGSARRTNVYATSESPLYTHTVSRNPEPAQRAAAEPTASRRTCGLQSIRAHDLWVTLGILLAYCIAVGVQLTPPRTASGPPE